MSNKNQKLNESFAEEKRECDYTNLERIGLKLELEKYN